MSYYTEVPTEKHRVVQRILRKHITLKIAEQPAILYVSTLFTASYQK